MDPDQIRVKVALIVFLIAGIDLGLAFLMRGVHESTPDGIDR